MQVDFQTKNYTAKEGLKEVIIKKLDRLDKFFTEKQSIKVMMKKSKEIETLELTIFVDNSVLRAEVTGRQDDTMYDLIDVTIPKIEKQIIKHNNIMASKRNKSRQKEIVATIKQIDDEAKAIVRKKTYELSPLSEAEAMEKMEQVGHSFYVFYNKETSTINVLYKRNDGDYGIIDTVV